MRRATNATHAHWSIATEIALADRFIAGAAIARLAALARFGAAIAALCHLGDVADPLPDSTRRDDRVPIDLFCWQSLSAPDASIDLHRAGRRAAQPFAIHVLLDRPRWARL